MIMEWKLKIYWIYKSLLQTVKTEESSHKLKISHLGDTSIMKSSHDIFIHIDKNLAHLHDT